MKWIMLLIAGMTEVTWAVAMKAAEGFTKTVPSVITVVGYVLSAVFRWDMSSVPCFFPWR